MSNPLASLFGQQAVGQGWGQSVHPLAIAQIAAAYPALLPLLTQQSAYGQVPYGSQSLLGGYGQPANPLSTVLSLLGQQGYGQPFGGYGQPTNPLNTILSLVAQQRGQQISGQQYGGFGQQTNPLSVILSLIGQQGAQQCFAPQGFGQQVGLDPFTVAQQLSQWSQSQLPIRPLVSPQQFDPFQASSLTSVIGGQTIDPCTTIAATCLPSPFAVSPLHPALRPQAVTPWTINAGIAPLASPIAPLASAIAPLASPIVPLVSPIAPLASPIVPLVSPIAQMMQCAAQPCIY
ncbi:MAG: hypothetical protein AB7U82_02875 [Blastocatellales bacterium]